MRPSTNRPLQRIEQLFVKDEMGKFRTGYARTDTWIIDRVLHVLEA